MASDAQISDEERRSRKEVLDTIDRRMDECVARRNWVPQTDKTGDFAQYSFFGDLGGTTARLYYNEHPPRLVILDLGEGKALHEVGKRIEEDLRERITIQYQKGTGKPLSL